MIRIRPQHTPRRSAGDALFFQPAVDLLLSTPASIVVRARVLFEGESVGQEAGLVISRQCCDGDRPSLGALRNAAQTCAARLSRCGQGLRRVRGLLVRVLDAQGARWMPMWQLEPVHGLQLDDTR